MTTSKMIQQPSSSNADYIDLRSLYHILLNNKWLLFFISLTTCLIAIFYSLTIPTQYQTNLLLKIHHKQHNVLGTITTPHQQLSIANMSDEPLAMQIALIQSEFILKPVIHQLGLDISITPYKSSFQDYLYTTNTDTIKIDELSMPPKYLNTELKLKVDNEKQYSLYDKRNNLLLQGQIGELAKNNEGLTLKISKIAAQVHHTFSFIKHQEFDILNKIRRNIKITDLSGSSENNTNKAAIIRVSLLGYDPNRITKILNQIGIMTRQQNIRLKQFEADKTLTFLNQQLPLVKKSLKEAETKLNEFKSFNGKIDIHAQTESFLNHLSDIKKQLEQIHLKKIHLLQIYTANHPDVISLEQETNELKKNQHALLLQLKKLPASEQETITLKREVDVKNRLYILLLNQIHQLNVIKNGIMGDVEILSYASTPYTLPAMNVLIVGFFGLVIGFLLACIGVISWRMLMQRVDDPHWTEQTWNIKNLAVIPYSKQQASYSKRYNSQQQKYLPLLAARAPSDKTIEALCILRTFLQLSIKHSSNNIVSLMGISNGVGKTFIALNLAYLLARTSKKVLVIDGDIRDSHMSQYFNNSSITGLTDVINGIIPIEKAIVRTAESEYLDYLPVGTKSEIAADLLMCNEFKTILLELSKKYQYVFINTPQNISYADNFLIGTLAGVNLLILGRYMHEASQINKVINNFNHADIKLTGYIFNHSKPHKKYLYSNNRRIIPVQNKQLLNN